MIIFPDLNSTKITRQQTNDVDYYRNTLYQDLARGISQRNINTKTVAEQTFLNFQPIIFQMWVPVSQNANVNISVNLDGVVTSYGTVSAPINGASAALVLSYSDHNIYKFTIPYQVIGEGFILIEDQFEDENYTSELFCVSEARTTKQVGRTVLSLDYTAPNGLKNGYYWSGETQILTLSVAELVGSELEFNIEPSESKDKEVVVLDSSALRKDTYELTNIPYYLYEKVFKASILNDLQVNGEAMTFVDAPVSDKRDGKVDFELIYKEKNLTNIY